MGRWTSSWWLSGIEFLRGLIWRRRSPRAERWVTVPGASSLSAWSCWESRQVDGWRGPKGFRVSWSAQWVFRPGMPWSRAGTVGLRRESGGLVWKSVLPHPPAGRAGPRSIGWFQVDRRSFPEQVLLTGLGPGDGEFSPGLVHGRYGPLHLDDGAGLHGVAQRRQMNACGQATEVLGVGYGEGANPGVGSFP